jgi:hypothetical protein
MSMTQQHANPDVIHDRAVIEHGALGGRILDGERRAKSVPEILAGQGHCSF